MRNFALCLLFLIANHFLSNCYAQKQPEVSKPKLEIRNENLIIIYDIIDSDPDDKFKVWIEITDAGGGLINAKSLTGDIGENIAGGLNKRIVWNYKTDNFNTDTEIHIQVSAEIISAPVTVAEKKDIPVKQYKPGSIILKSALLPGLGFVSMDKSKLHLVKGLAGYGCIASSIILNRMAVQNYDRYLSSFEITDSDNYYNTSVNQYNLSRVFAYTAIAIWATEIVWIILDLNANNNLFSRHGKGLFVEPKYDYCWNVSLISLSYNF